MKHFLTILLLCSFTVLIAQGGDIINTTGTNDNTSSFSVTNPAGNPLFNVYGGGWSVFGDDDEPPFPLFATSGFYDDDAAAAGNWLQPVGLFLNSVQERDGIGVSGYCDNNDYWGIGVHGQGGWTGVYGSVFSDGTDNTLSYNGVHGYAEGVGGLSKGISGDGGLIIGVNGYGVDGHRAYGLYGVGHHAADRSYGTRGYAYGSPINYGVYGYGATAVTDGNSYGVFGHAEGENAKNYGVYGYATGATNNWAGYFYGDLYCTGTLSKGSGSFKIDHPLDPQNKFLSHSFVESPDMMNIYNGNVELNYSGEALVTLPDWFEPLNSEYRYQLTAIGAPGPNLFIAQEVNGNSFRIAGGTAGMKVSWQITGVRQDAYAKKNRIQVEERKSGKDIGKYLHPEAFGLSISEGINYDMIPKERESLSKDNIRTKIKIK